MEVEPSSHLDSQWALSQVQTHLCLISFDFTSTHTGRAIVSTSFTRLVPCLPYTQQVLSHETAMRVSTTNHGNSMSCSLGNFANFRLWIPAKAKASVQLYWGENRSVFSIFVSFQGPPLTVVTIFLIMQWCQNIPSELAGRRRNFLSSFGNKHSVCEASTALEDRTTAPPVEFLRTTLWYSQHSLFPLPPECRHWPLSPPFYCPQWKRKIRKGKASPEWRSATLVLNPKRLNRLHLPEWKLSQWSEE